MAMPMARAGITIERWGLRPRAAARLALQHVRPYGGETSNSRLAYGTA